MTLKTINLKNIKNESTKINFEYEEGTIYTVLDVKKELYKFLGEGPDKLDIVIIYNGSVLKDDFNVATEEFFDKTMVYFKKPVKKPVTNEETSNVAQDVQNNIVTQVNSSTSNLQDQLNNININQISRSLVNTTIAILQSNPTAFRQILSLLPNMNTELVDTLINPPYSNQIMDELRNITGEEPSLPNGIFIHLQNPVQIPTNINPNEMDFNTLQSMYNRIISNPNLNLLQSMYNGMTNNLREEYDEEEEYNDQEDREEGNIELNPQNNINPVNNIMSQFSNEEVLEIQNIINMGYNSYDVIQMYVACDKNPDLTIQNLSYSE